MAEVAGAVGGLLTCLCAPNCLNTPVVERCKYAMNHSKDIAELRKKKETLIAHKEYMSKRLDASEVNEGKTRSGVVMNWLKEVDQVLEKANAIEEKVTKAKQGLARLIPSFCSHSRMGSSISRLLNEVEEILQRYAGISGESLAVLEGERGKEYPVEKIIGKTTALKTMEIVWGCLMNDEIRTIGVYGMGGVGKTTIVKEINNRLIKQEHLFESVIWVTVSKSTSIRQIQACVAREIGLTLPVDEDEMKISASLLGALKRRKKFLLILDDMWEEVSLPEIGIPEPTEENGGKILLTTRLLGVCRKMRCPEQSTIRVELLSKNEAWELFINTLGVKLSEENRKIAEDLVEQCDRLPLAIITVGGTMREYSDITEWRLALNDLRDYGGQIIDMEKRVFKCLKFSYDRLPGDMFRKCFLLCALYPEDYNIRTQQLIEYWIMGGMIVGTDGQDEIDKGRYILNKLKNHCLLVSVDHTEEVSEREKELSASVKMHDLIRDMALQFARVLVKDDVFLKKLPSEVEWREDLEGASFMRCYIKDISSSPKCPKLSILLFHSTRFRSISDCFFVQMQGLRVLDLGGNRNMQSLPNSISDLVNLRALVLNECSKLKCLPSLSKLQLLRILDLSENVALQLLPDSISDLTKLVELRLSKCYKLERVPSVAKLHHLRTLQLGGTGITELPHGLWKLVNLKQLEMEALDRLESRGGLVEGLLSMKDMEFLDIRFASVSECTDFVGSPSYMGLKDFRIKIKSGPRVAYFYRKFHDSNRSLEMYGPADGPYTGNFVPKNTECLYIESFDDIRSLNDFKCLTDARQLRACEVSSCDQLECIIKQEGECSLLESMEELTIYSCPKFHSVYEGIPSTTQHLKKLTILQCHNLKNVFSSPRLLQQLQNLEDLFIIECEQVEEIIKSPTAEASNIIALPKLKTFEVRELKNLKNIWSSEMVCNSLQVISVTRCSAMKRLPIIRGDHQSPPPLLTKIIGEIEWWDSLEWDHPFAKTLFQPFFNRWNGNPWE